MNITEKQKSFITNLVERDDDLEKIWEQIPRNNDKYPDVRCDYKRVIFGDRLNALDTKQSSNIINIILNTKLSSAKRGRITEVFNENRII